jgi:hypothetical protein
MSGYSLFIRIFFPIYQQHYYVISKLPALGTNFFHYAAYLWNSMSIIEQLRWNNIAITKNYNDRSLKSELLLFLISNGTLKPK